MSGPAPLRLRSGAAEVAVRALGVALLLVSMLSAQLLARLDRVHVHVRCEEHGELVHADNHGRPALASSAAPTRPASTLDVGDPAPAHDHHDHCLIGDPMVPLAARPPAVMLQMPAGAAPVTSPPALATRGHAYLLLLAPKTSPPARA